MSNYTWTALPGTKGAFISENRSWATRLERPFLIQKVAFIFENRTTILILYKQIKSIMHVFISEDKLSKTHLNTHFWRKKGVHLYKKFYQEDLNTCFALCVFISESGSWTTRLEQPFLVQTWVFISTNTQEKVELNNEIWYVQYVFISEDRRLKSHLNRHFSCKKGIHL